MKKLFLLVVAITVMCFSSVAMAASNSQVLAKEEAAVSQTMSALTGNTSYDVVSQEFAPELVASLDKKGLADMKKEVRAKLGKMTDMRLVAIQKFNDGDRVTYLASFSKEQLVKVEFVFKIDGDNVKVWNFSLVPMEQQAAPTEQSNAQAEQK